MIRSTGSAQPYAYMTSPPPPPPGWAPPPPGWGAPPPSWSAPPPYAPALDDGRAFREVTMGSAGHSAALAAVGGAIGFFVRGPVGALWGAAIGTGLAQAFLQFLVRMADGGGPRAPLYAAAPTALTAAAAWAAHAAWGAGAAAWTLVLLPAAILGAMLAWHSSTR